ATGYCSFPDEDCKSGQRYGELVGDMLAETCVEPSPPGGESELGDESGGDDGGTDDGRGQDPEDDDGGGGEDTGSQDPTVGGTIGPDCWRDDFDDTFLDPRWCPVSPSGTYLTEVGGSLQVFLEDDGWGPGHRDVRLASCMDIPFAQSRLTVRVDEVLLGSPETESYVEFQNDDYGVGILYVDGNVWAYQWNGNDYVNLASLPYDAQDHAYWRLRSEHQGMVAELSPDGANWTTLHTYDVDVGDGSGTVKLGVWAEHAPNGGDRAAQYGWLETCTPPS
ncbi:MAG: hypothetical protein K0V04_20885, partial [Deltaproteobacteria bacterium]|nr:hypothetical protein [Deltaproteobacteria bacterium]